MICSLVARDTEVIPDPVIVFEILSPSTATIDPIDKNKEYRDTPSIQRYVILEQATAAATIFERQGDNWVGHLETGDGVVAIPQKSE